MVNLNHCVYPADGAVVQVREPPAKGLQRLAVRLKTATTRYVSPWDVHALAKVNMGAGAHF